MDTRQDRINGLIGDLGIKAPVRVATTAAITLYGLQTIDGVTVEEEDRILVKDQADPAGNGIYIAQATIWVRAPDFDGARDCIQGTSVLVSEGTENALSLWALTTPSPVIGESDLTFVTYAGNGVYTPDGGIPRSIEDKLKETVSVTDYGATGDGITDDSAAINNAVTSGSYIYFPPGNYYIGAPISLPAKNMALFGAGRSSRIFGSVAALIIYPTSATDGSGNYVTQDIYSLAVETTADNVGVQMHQTWDASGKVGPTIRGCYFLNAGASTTVAKCLSLQGVWEVDIVGSHFMGKGVGGAPTTGIGGYGVYISLGANLNTCVMNVKLRGCRFLKLAFPYWCSDRAVDIGGRVESVQITDCWFVAGYKAIRSSESLATLIAGSLISDFDVGIELNGDFDFNIANNQQIDGATACIHLVATSTSITERGTITGNAIKAKGSSVGVLLSNSQSAAFIRSVSISGNIIGKVVVAETKLATGIKFDGTFSCVNIVIASNVFEQQVVAISYSAGVANTNIITSGNSYYGCDTTIANPSSSGYTYPKVYSASIAQAITGGSAQENIDVAIPANTFSAKPTSAHLMSDASHTVDPMIGFYSFLDAATVSTNARFMLTRLDGTNLVGATKRFTVTMHGVGYATS